MAKRAKTPYLPHYIGLNGLPGCLPDSCNVYETRKDAVDSLADFCELSKREARELRQTGSVYNRDGDGRGWGVCEVSECTCEEPWVHQDGQTEEQWKRENDWHEYEVIVGNMGSVYSGPVETAARKVFRDYSKIARSVKGHRAYQELVTLMCDGEIEFECDPRMERIAKLDAKAEKIKAQAQKLREELSA